MQAIMISIQPQWFKKILNGEKTIEIRKTMPKCELPVKVYIYCTKAKPYLYRVDDDNNFELTNNLRPQEECFVKDYNAQNGKVIAEFTLKNIVEFDIEGLIFMGKEKELMQKSCIGGMSLRNYLGNKVGYSWGIDNLKIYDKPKEMSEFYSLKKCDSCKKSGYESAACRYDEDCKIPIQITRPPQSWCYVEEI